MRNFSGVEYSGVDILIKIILILSLDKISVIFARSFNFCCIIVAVSPQIFA